MRRPGKKVELTDLEKGDPNSSYACAMTLLARRDYSSGELTRKLADRGYLEHAVEPVVEELLATNKLNDERYGQNFVAYRARRVAFGSGGFLRLACSAFARAFTSASCFPRSRSLAKCASRRASTF